MQVELYFGEDDISSPEDLYSPRNELQALNSILRLIDISHCSSMQMQKNLLQELHDAIIDMIHKFADSNSVKTLNVEDHNCDKENHMLEWGEQNGVRTRLQIACKYSLFFTMIISFVYRGNESFLSAFQYFILGLGGTILWLRFLDFF